MNALIDLGKCREYMTIVVGEKEHKIKLAGTMKEPYFCGRDVCDILGYIKYKDALQKFVTLKNKREFKTLINNGGNQPNEVDPNSMSNSLGQIDHKNLTYNEGKATYINEPGLYALIMNSNATFSSMFQELFFAYKIK